MGVHWLKINNLNIFCKITLNTLKLNTFFCEITLNSVTILGPDKTAVG